MRAECRLLVALTVSHVAGCATSAISRAPKTPDQPVPFAAVAEREPPSSDRPASRDAAGPPEPDNRVPVNPERVYDLAALIDLAQRHHPETREAWESARRAALGVGLAESTYLPQLSAAVIGGLQHTPLPIPKNVSPAGYFTTNTRELVPMLTARWLLYDFGRRENLVDAAKARSVLANVRFTAAHQQIVYAVSRDYYALGSARALLRVAEQASKNADVTLDATETRKAHGLATTVEEEQVRRQRAQTQFNVVRAKGAERSAYTALVADMGIEPSAQVAVSDSSEWPLPSLDGDLDAQIREALANQPDMRVAAEASEALQATMQEAKAAFYPQIALDAQVYQNIGALSTEGSPYYRVNDPGANVMIAVSVPIFDGGERSAHLAIARSEWSASAAAMERVRLEIRRRVTEAHDALETHEAEYQAALAVEEAAAVAYDSALAAYRQGVGTYIELVNTETALTQAKTEKETAHANELSSAAALVFALGRMSPPAR